MGLGTLVFGLLLGAVSGHLAKAGSPGRVLGRTTVHIAVLSAAVPAQFWLGFWGVVLYGTVLTSVVALGYLRKERSSLYRILAADEGEATSGPILLPMAATALGGGLGVLLVGPFALVGYLVCGWGDGAAGMVGRVFGHRRYTRPFLKARAPFRTLEGSTAFLVSATLGGWAALSLLGHPTLTSIGMGVVVSLVGTVAEGMSGKGTDNFWTQLLPSLTAWWFLG